MKYFSLCREVWLGLTPKDEKAKLICKAESQRLAKKIASILNDFDNEKKQEYFMYGTKNPKRHGEPPKSGEGKG